MNRKKSIIAVIIIIIDQITKLIVQTYETNITIIKNVFAIRYYENTGAAWSILEGKQSLLIILSILMIIIVYSMMFSFKNNKLTNWAFGILFGGILGNFIDRIFFGYVRDFISLTIFNYRYPIFNVADMAIVMGAIMLVVITLKGEKKDGDKRRSRGKDKD